MRWLLRRRYNDCRDRDASHDYAELDADIRILHDALNEAVGQLSGDDMSQLVARLRDDAERLRAGTLVGGRDAFAATMAKLSTDQLDIVARVFTQWFHLVNSAEEQHRIQGRILQLGIVLRTGSALARVNQDSVIIESIHTGRQTELEAAQVVMTTSRLPLDSLYHSLAGRLSIERIGDCLAPGTIATSVYPVIDTHVKWTPR